MVTFISIKNAIKKKSNEIKLLVSSSPLSFFLPFLSQLGTLFKHLYTLDLCFQLFYWFFHLFFNLPTTSLLFRDHPLRLVGIQFWVFLLVPAVCPGSLGLSWSRQKSQITTLPLGTLHPWAALCGSRIPQALESSREAGLRDWLVNKAWHDASLGSLGFAGVLLLSFLLSWNKALGARVASIMGFLRTPRCAPLPVRSAAGASTSPSLRLLVWNPHIYLAESLRVLQGTNLIKVAAGALIVPMLRAPGCSPTPSLPTSHRGLPA